MPHLRDSRQGTTPSLPKGSFDPPHRNVWIAFLCGSATSTNRGRSRHVLPAGRQELDASAVPRTAVNAVLNEDETELRIFVVAVLAKVLLDGLGPLHEEVQNLRDRRSEALLLEDTQELDAIDQLKLWHTEAVLQRDNNDDGVILLRHLPTRFWRSSGFSLNQLEAQRMYWSVAKIYPCPVHTSVLPNWASTNETEQTAPKSNNITAKRRTNSKTDKKMKTRATEPST